jgi:hypothetical protein
MTDKKLKLKEVKEIITRLIIFLFIAYVSISAFIGCQLACANKETIDMIIELDTVQSNKIKQLIKSNNKIVEKVDFLMFNYYGK